MDQLDQLLRQARSILQSMWARRWIGVITAWIVGSVAAVVITRMPDQYEAVARIYVDTQSVLKPLMAGLTVQPNVDQQVMILSRTLISRPNIEKLVRMTDLDHGLKTTADRERLVDSLGERLKIAAAGGINLYTLAFRDTNPQTAQRVVQSLTSMFVESSLGGKRKDTDAAKLFIEEQIKIYEKKLAEAENRLKEFKLRNMNLNISDGKDSFGRMGEASAMMSQARLALREAENSRDALKRQIEGEEPTLLDGFSGGDSGLQTPSVPEIDNRITAMKQSLDTLLQRYTEQHPDVAGTRRVIRDLEEQKKQELAARKAAAKPRSPGAIAPAANNPVYQQLKISLAEAEANVASLRTRVAEYDARYNRARTDMRMLPEIESEFVQLNRDYAVHKSNYDSLVGRRESATMSGELEANSGMAEFRLIDPPRVIPQPVAPNRLRLLSLALLGAIAAGAAASFAASQIRRRFFDAYSLENAMGIPVLGTVSLIESEPLRRKERRSLLAFIAATLALLGSYGAGILLLSLAAART